MKREDSDSNCQSLIVNVVTPSLSSHAHKFTAVNRPTLYRHITVLATSLHERVQ